MIETVLLLAGAGGLAAAAVAGRLLSGKREEAEEDEGPSPGEVIRSVALELVSQSRPEKREELARVLLEHLSRGGTEWAQLAVPCDRRGTPVLEFVERVATAVAEAAGAEVRVERVVLESWPLALVTAGEGADPSDASWVLARVPRRARYGARYGAGGLLALVVQTVISASIGTVTSMGVQSLVRSAGGERRLARMLRRHRDAEASGDADRAARIREKILASASRIKGRQVDWSEVASLEARG